ncbi:MAG: YcgN family cysteine cluster protein [Pseudomonadota bacterium]
MSHPLPSPVPQGTRRRFWERVPLSEMTEAEWEALCDGCGKCCLLKLEDADTGEVHYTDIACRLFDDRSCRCGNYALRRQLVAGCIVLSVASLPEVVPWLPRSCAYRRLYEGRGLAEWHPLNSQDPESVHDAGISVRARTVPEWEVAEEDQEEHIIDADL